jgi:drug/metabolite transporter (DMT)-like permease
VLLLAIPTVFDLAATVLMNVGLLSVTASVYQMMRGAEMLFAALFTVVFLKRSLNRLHFLGMLFCVVRPPLQRHSRAPLTRTCRHPALRAA